MVDKLFAGVSFSERLTDLFTALDDMMMFGSPGNSYIAAILTIFITLK